MKAFILAAGQGSRLLPLTSETPKTLLNISGTTILEYQLVTLASCGIHEVVIIGGFRMDKLRESAERYVALHGLHLTLKFVHNKEYDRTNNLFSLWLAREEMTGDFVVINGDNVFDRRALIRSMAVKDASVIMAIHRNPSYDDEDMKVRIAGDRVIEVSKKIDNQIASGESIGLRVFRGPGVEGFRHAMDMEMLEDVERKAFFVKAIQYMIDHSHEVAYADVTEYQYGELDFHEDLKDLQLTMSGMMLQTIMLYTNPAGVYAQGFKVYGNAALKRAG